MTGRLLPTLLLLLAALTPATAEALDAKQFKKEFARTQDSWERRKLVEQLDPTDPDSYDVLLNFVLKTQDWYLRDAATDVLATVYDEAVIVKLCKLKDKKPGLSEAVALGLGRSQNPERAPYLIELLGSKKWKVRRAAAVGLAGMKTKAALEALISALEKEEELLVRVRIIESLERLTLQTDRTTAKQWQTWWFGAEDAFEFDDGDRQPPERKVDRIEATIEGIKLSAVARGQGPALFVLPDLGYQSNYLQTYLAELEDAYRVFYLDIPRTVDFEKLRAGNPYTLYPLERVADALWGLKNWLAKAGKLRGNVRLLAHGNSTWTAMVMAARHPKGVRRSVLVAPSSGSEADSEGIGALEKRGVDSKDTELEHLAQSRTLLPGSGMQGPRPRYEARSDEEAAALRRKALTIRFADTRDGEIGRIFGPLGVVDGKWDRRPRLFRPTGAILPTFSLFKLNKVPTPTLVLHGAKSIDTSTADAKAIAKHYGAGGKLVVFKRSAQMPFVEENAKFITQVSRFLEKK